jgi:diguanylate cyclase (GGDEF)-like protein/PAS domain S-box-containing protein
MSNPIRVLFVQNPENMRCVVQSLRGAGIEVAAECVCGAAELESALAMKHWDAVIAELEIPSLPGMDALTIFRATGLDIPFILMSSAFVEDIAVSAIKAGASDYVTRDRLARLVPVLTRELAETQLRSAHRKSQRDLRESEERFRSLTVLSSDWYWEQDENLRFTYVSASLRDKYSEALEAWAGKTRWELPYRNADWTAHREAVDARRPFHDVELQPFRHDGSTVYITVSGEPKLDGQGNFLGYRGVGKDITERVKDAEALRSFRTAMDATLDAITLVSRSTLCFIEVNATAAEMLGYTRAELMALGPAQVSAITREELEHAYDSMIAGEGEYGVVRTRLRRKDGSWFPVDVRQHIQRVGEDWTVIGVVRDHSESNDAEEKLRRLNRLYAMVSATNTLVVRVHDRAQLFAKACSIAVEQGEFEQAWIGVLDSDDMKIKLVASAGLDAKTISSINTHYSSCGDLCNGDTLAARAIKERAAIVSNDVQNDSELVFGNRCAASGMRSLAMLPLIVSDKVIGVFALHTGQLEFFDAEGLRLLTELAGNVAFALDHLEKQDRLDYLAYYDDLTGLANRSLFLDRSTQYLRSAVTGDHKLALVLVDLERFKKINDTLGRPIGDVLLTQVAKWLVSHVGDVNTLARVAADHFAIILPEVAHEADVARALQKMLTAFLGHAFHLNGVEYRIAAKVGVALFPDDGADADTLFKNAEVAVRKAKLGGHRYLFYTQKMTETVAGSLGLESRLRQALEREEFVLHYQPKVNITSGLLTGAEALLRWNDPQSGLMPPCHFIPLLEETGLIHEVGRWALRQAIQDYQRWCRVGLAPVRIAVNVSPLQLHDRSFVADIERLAAAGPHAAQGLELELTESLVMEDVAHSIATLHAIRSLGVTIAIDDFGTGFSSLSYLSKLPVDTLKIDRSFVTDMVASADGMTLVSVIVNLAHALKLKVVAEGVETEEQLRILRLLGCDEMQGFLFGKAVPAKEFEARYLDYIRLARRVS